MDKDTSAYTQKPEEHTEAEDQPQTETPIWASSEPDVSSQDPVPPPTYDPSTFSAPIDAVPTFKPRKTNRVSVLAYPTNDDSQGSTSTPITTTARSDSPSLPAPHQFGGGPPSLIGSSLTSVTPPPPSGASGIKLPPPPTKSLGTGPAPVPYTKGDFRTAEIVNHWNDPPTQIFAKKAQGEGAAAHDFGPMKEALASIIKDCSANVPAAQKRMFEDTVKRLQALQEQMENGTVKERVVEPLDEMIQALSTRSFTQCHAIHAKLMQTEFESEGKWLLGFKRLIELYASLPSSS